MGKVHHIERPRRSGQAHEARLKLMRACRAACARAGLDDDARRDMQAGLVERGIVRHASMADMSLRDLGLLLDHLNQGWIGSSGHRAHIGKIHALWWSLYWLGALHDPKPTAIDAFVRRQTGVSALRFLDHRGAAAVIEALKAWGAREGVAWSKAVDTLADRRAVFHELHRRLDVQVAGEALTATGLSADTSPSWQRHELDAAIKALGKAVRRVSGARAVRDA